MPRPTNWWCGIGKTAEARPLAEAVGKRELYALMVAKLDCHVSAYKTTMNPNFLWHTALKFRAITSLCSLSSTYNVQRHSSRGRLVLCSIIHVADNSLLMFRCCNERCPFLERESSVQAGSGILFNVYSAESTYSMVKTWHKWY